MEDLLYYIPNVISGLMWVALVVISIVAMSTTKMKGWGMMVAFSASRILLLIITPILFRFGYDWFDMDNFHHIVNWISFLLNLIPIVFLSIGLYQFYQFGMQVRRERAER